MNYKLLLNRPGVTESRYLPVVYLPIVEGNSMYLLMLDYSLRKLHASWVIPEPRITIDIDQLELKIKNAVTRETIALFIEVFREL